MIDPTTVTGAKLVMDLFKMAADYLLKKPKPDVTAALTLMSQLQEHFDQLRSVNLELERKLLQAERQNFELQKVQQKVEVWEHTKALYELRQIFPGTWVYVPKDGSARRLCQQCFERDHREMTLQDGSERDQYLRCKTCNAAYQISQFDYSIGVPSND